jgi:hypothetical protein
MDAEPKSISTLERHYKRNYMDISDIEGSKPRSLVASIPRRLKHPKMSE